MNKSNFAHALLAVGFQAICVFIAWLFGVSLLVTAMASGSVASSFYFAREVTQAERKAGTPPWYSGFLPKNWSKDNFFDFVTPLLGNTLFVLAIAML